MRFVLKLFALIPFVSVCFLGVSDQVQANNYDNNRAVLFMGDLNNSDINISQISRKLWAEDFKVVTNGMDTSVATQLQTENLNFTSFQYENKEKTGYFDLADKILNSGYVFNALVFCFPGLSATSLSVDNISKIIEIGALPLLDFLENVGPNLKKSCRILTVISQSSLDLLKSSEASILLSNSYKGIDLENLIFQTIKETISNLNRKHTLDGALFATIITDRASSLDNGEKFKKHLMELSDTDFQSIDMQKL